MAQSVDNVYEDASMMDESVSCFMPPKSSVLFESPEGHHNEPQGIQDVIRQIANFSLSIDEAQSKVRMAFHEEKKNELDTKLQTTLK